MKLTRFLPDSRIILDEAQNIRNRNTKTSRAVSHLDGLYRWALTGTPVTNSLADLYPLFRFLQLKPWYKWKDYREHVIIYEKREPDIAGRKAQAILRSCMLRRKKDSKLYDALVLAVSGEADPVFTFRSDGKELITLPPKEIKLHQIEFSPEEREIYDFIEKKAQTRFNKFLKAGTVMKNYSHVLAMLLRLRQVCLHPALVADAQATLQRQEQNKYELKDELERAKTTVGGEFVRKAKKIRLEAAVERCKAEKDGDEARADECSVCLEIMQANEGGGVITRCLHSFCRTCIEDTIKQPMVEDAGDENTAKCTADQRPCPICRQPVGLDDLYMLEAFEPTDEELSDEMDVATDVDHTLGGFIVEDGEASDDDDAPVFKKKTPKQPSRAIIQDLEEEDADAQTEAEVKKDKGKGKAKEDSHTMTDVGWMKEQEPSTKMIWMFAELERIFKEHPDDKVLIISSFTTALGMVADLLDSKGIRHCRYQGDMSNSDREQALRILRKSKKCKVMLPLPTNCRRCRYSVSEVWRRRVDLDEGQPCDQPRCVSAISNMRRVRAYPPLVLKDLAWSNAVEEQAFGRVHRIGQENDRLTIANTVEQRMFDLQVKKQGLADASLGEGKAQKLGKLTVQDLAMLFGIKPKAGGRWA
ncbi:SPOSA6832_00205 [Sporobolomyces salmonicolor]|uniref:SPOSA6832_00205-mRNA-1:cds n=1 Tax=Sporidiobolus salmonicolor TaxID=5005 RepID=A0A0D6EG41_SPOSA|nr:SPOSA6832_00205 [Sporobolomyces salmonicolor]